MATKLSSDNSDDKTLNCMIEYDQDTTLEIKEENTQGQATAVGQKFDEQYETNLQTAHIGEADISGAQKQFPSLKKQKVQESKLEKNYTCEKCARSYKNKPHLNRHQKFECGVLPQFICTFCDKRFKRNLHLQQHIVRVHNKTNIRASQTKYNCDKCSRSYSSSDALTFHIRLEHTAVKPQFICDICGYKTKRKPSLSRHISSIHLGCTRSRHTKRRLQN
ncbi:zinc finger protein 81-like [Belonocnema kinseyi]|uniref:zinc finger protein 81-like n=1 Tax=Belonocnema kinseyi TaxID=2817044 RepID=UPI00143DD23B|nr:zinc finger protein 81-like [Belonocnema kinseyi]